MFQLGIPHRHERFRSSKRKTIVAPGLLRDDRGAALLEFAISLPLLVVFCVGIYDFSGAFNEKQKIQQAAQEGAIVAGAEPMSDIQTTNGNPESLQAVVTAILNSLVGSRVVPTGTCSAPQPSGPVGLTWTYTFPNCPLTIVIDRGSICSTGAACATAPPMAVGTVIQVTYPYVWRFNSVIQLLVPGATYAGTTMLTESATVHNQL
jgi:TadE-like protein